MAKHQIIYTSCMRGIDGANDGQQIFSYDEEFKDKKTDEVKKLFSYHVPELPIGTLMSDEIVGTMPQAFIYRLLKSGIVSITLNTYLGRDYMGSTGRFGNHMSHSVLCDFDELDVYPCELYYSTMFRSSMEYEEVNNPNPPMYLQSPEVVRGDVINLDAIIEFLGRSDNLERYKQMIIAMLRFKSEKKRLIICDTQESIIRWIAALHYALPLDIAKKINFATYEFDPELSSSQICGVVADGSRYICEEYTASNKHYVFDFINESFPTIDTDDIFLDFIDTAMSFSTESLMEFHLFVHDKTIYRECDEEYYAAYYFYFLVYDNVSNIFNIPKEQFSKIINFVEKYITNDIKVELLYKLMREELDAEQLENENILKYVDVLSESVLANMTIGKLTDDNIAIIKELYKYYMEIILKPINGRLLLFTIANRLNEIKEKKDIYVVVDELKTTAEIGAKFINLTEYDIKDYFEWAFDSLSKISILKEDFDVICSLFEFNDLSDKLFMEYWSKVEGLDIILPDTKESVEEKNTLHSNIFYLLNLFKKK